MRKIMSMLLGAALLATGPAIAAPKLTGEERLAREIEGRVAGKPVDWVTLHKVRTTRKKDRTPKV